MHVDRRTFLKGTAAVGGAMGLGLFDLSEARAEMRELKISRTTETRSTCPYCSVSCGVIIHTLGDKAKNVTGPRSCTSRGTPTTRSIAGRSVPRASRLKNDIQHPGRLTAPEGPAPRLGPLGGDLLGRGHRRHRRHIKDDPRPDLRRQERGRGGW